MAHTQVTLVDLLLSHIVCVSLTLSVFRQKIVLYVLNLKVMCVHYLMLICAETAISNPFVCRPPEKHRFGHSFCKCSRRQIALDFRFHIQLYNQDSLIACVLPYHETKVFVRVIQLLKIEDPTHKWHWLHGLQVSHNVSDFVIFAVGVKRAIFSITWDSSNCTVLYL